MSESAVRLDSVTRVNPETLTSKVGASYRFRYIDITAVSTGKVNVPSDEVRYADAPSRARRLLRKGDILLSTVRPNLKAFAHFSESDGEYVASTGFAVLRALPGNDPRYLFSCLLTDDVARQMAALAVGSNYPALTSSDVRSLLIPALGFDAQGRIADILSTVDEAIEKTEALIAKQQQIKAGLMQDLFSRGVLPDGRLRPTRDEAPELYKETPLGWLPKEWEVTTLAAVTQSWAMGPRFAASEYSENGNVATLRTTDIDYAGRISYFTMPRANLTLRTYQSHLLQRGDFLITRSGTCGIACVFEEFDAPVLPGAFLIRFRFGGAMSPYFLREYVNSALGAPRVARLAEGGVQKNLRGTSLERLTVPRPSLSEQSQVDERLNHIDESLDIQLSSVEVLKRLKAGLMADLLSGRLRVDARAEPVGA